VGISSIGQRGGALRLEIGGVVRCRAGSCGVLRGRAGSCGRVTLSSMCRLPTNSSAFSYRGAGLQQLFLASLGGAAGMPVGAGRGHTLFKKSTLL